MPWIKMVNESTPDDSGGGSPRIIAHPEKVPIPDGRVLSDLTVVEAAAEGWFEFTELRYDENIQVPGEPFYVTTNRVVHRTYPNAELKDAELLRKYKRALAGSEYKRQRDWFVFAGDEFKSDPERAGVVSLQLSTTRGAGYTVRARDGTRVAMNNATFRQYAAAMANHHVKIEAEGMEIADEIAFATGGQEILDVDHKAYA
jgi:hypothetical protein